ncbi:MAG: FHA domain-containing protein [Ruminococcus sp.]|nr:FHA domain-containing protein [Ruminococcus sp.]
MASIRCPQCGYENPEGSVICDICAETLVKAPEVPAPTAAEIPQPAPMHAMNVPDRLPEQVSPVTESSSQQAASGETGRQYYVFCPESQAKTIVKNGEVTRFYCEGCHIEHDIDGFLWQIEVSEETAPSAPGATAPQQTAPGSDDLWLEEINTGFRIDIAKTGGTLGRYGNFGSEFFLSHNMHTVSGEHCRITYEYGSWVLRHISRTNSTHYNGVSLTREEPNLLEDGKLLVLANTVTLRVHIG